MKHFKTLLIGTACTVGAVMVASAAEPQVLPWDREVSLREAAQSVSIQGVLNPTDLGRGAMSINNLKMHAVLWGPPDRITISINKNNVWDRRLHDFPAPTLQDITEGAFSPANSDYVGVKEIDSIPFADVDFLDLPSFARKLAKKPDEVSAFLSGNLDEKTAASLAAYRAAKSGSASQARPARQSGGQPQCPHQWPVDLRGEALWGRPTAAGNRGAAEEEPAAARAGATEPVAAGRWLSRDIEEARQFVAGAGPRMAAKRGVGRTIRIATR